VKIHQDKSLLGSSAASALYGENLLGDFTCIFQKI
jgi:hypothetical protein